ncbi:AMP-binding protein [filamentous cyanobacterium LEGE 11480]|uniref:AMP-binding protein n=1 Tax=Romeriopsis navalis LEGE 11480 TaxID=2777977 RepID=A0A928VIB2_9CYAN|nr:AMP-binding protein [Romeriopsis navalis]MBE9029121.1 AMP-binding protein [Romeriopsis navalis LEGE 11480]
MGEARISEAFLMGEQERQNLANTSEYVNTQSLPEVWAIACKRFHNLTAVIDPHSKPETRLTYGELYQGIQDFAAGLQSLGLTAAAADDYPPRVALFADNCPRWMMADQGVMLAGGIDAVRGSQADPDELGFILENSGAIGLIAHDLALFQKLRHQLLDRQLKFVILLTGEAATDEQFELLTFEQVISKGKDFPLQPAQQDRSTIATLMYTSGTSGMPKGVMLSHGNLIHQPTAAAGVVQMQPEDKVLSILPIWHAYERSFEYFLFSRGCTQIYTNIRYVKQDLKQFQPQYMVGVPRLWESIYEGIQKQFRDQPAKKQKLVNFFLKQSLSYIQAKRITQGLSLETTHPSAAEKAKAMAKRAALSPIHRLGGKLVYQKIRDGLGGKIEFVVSGGGSIADHLEDFFEIVGVVILSGYGLTETSPITNVRRPWCNIRGADGQPMLDTEVRIVDLTTRQALPFNQQGLILIRGPQVMQGYFRNPEATAKALDADGWFDTGDLGMLLEDYNLIITGRAKDTIVLTNGENIEPQPIEEHLANCPYVDQVMLVGQDQKNLGALIVPNLEALENHLGHPPDLNSPTVQDLFQREITQRIKQRPGYRSDDRIGAFRLIEEPFSAENGLLTQTLKVKRNVVSDRYRDQIAQMFR